MFIRRAIMTATLMCSISMAQSAASHPEGHEPIDDERAIEIARDVATDLAMEDAGLGFGKLDPSWRKLPAEVIRVHVKRSGYYIVSLRNDAESKTLYVLMSNLGDVYDANLTGEFPGLDE